LAHSLSASHLCLAFFLSLDLSFHCLPVNLNLLVKLGEPLVSLLLLVLFEEALSISDHRVNMSLLCNCNVKSLVPFVHLDVHLDSSVVETSSHENRLSLVNLLAVKREGSVTSRFTWQLLDVVDILDLVSFIDDGKSDLKGVKFAAVNRHSSETRPQGLLLNETA